MGWRVVGISLGTVSIVKNRLHGQEKIFLGTLFFAVLHGCPPYFAPIEPNTPPPPVSMDVPSSGGTGS